MANSTSTCNAQFLWNKTELPSSESSTGRIVEKAVHYIDSSASTYALGKGMVDITFAENQSLTPLKAVSSGNTIVD